MDSVSVEAGVGPVCRERHGYGTAQGEFDEKAYLAAMGTNAGPPGVAKRDARTIANNLTHRIAANPTERTVSRHIAAIDALGYHRLAATLAERAMGPLIEVTEAHDAQGTKILVLRAPFSEELLGLGTVPGSRWDGIRKATTIPASSAAALVEALRRRLPPTTLVRGRNGRLKLLGGKQ